MFDVSWGEMIVIGVVALIVIGPKELPGVIRAVQLLASGRRSVSRADQWPAMPIKFGEVQKIELPSLQFKASLS